MKEKPFEPLAVTEEVRSAARARMEADGKRARRDGVYERFRQLRGKIKWSVSLDELRKDD